MALFINFLGILQTLGDMGFFQFVLPFLLFLIIIDAILMSAKPMGGALNAPKAALLSAIISFFIVNFTPLGFALGQFLTNFFGVMSMYLTAVLVFVIFLGMGGYKIEDIWGAKYLYIGLFFLLTVVIFANSSPLGIPFLSLSTETLTLLFVLVLIGGVIAMLAKEPKAEGAGKTG